MPWNELPNHIRLEQNLNQFSKLLNTWNDGSCSGLLGTEHMRHLGTRYWTSRYSVLEISVLNNKNNLIEFKNLKQFFFTCRRCLCKFLCVFFSSPGHRPCELLSRVSVRPSVSFSHLNLLLWNRWTDFNQTCQKCSLDDPLRFVFLVLIWNPTWLPGSIVCSHWLKFKKSSCQKPLSQLNCDFAGMIIGWSCTKIVNRLPIRNSRWPPWLNLV